MIPSATARTCGPSNPSLNPSKNVVGPILDQTLKKQELTAPERLAYHLCLEIKEGKGLLSPTIDAVDDKDKVHLPSLEELDPLFDRLVSLASATNGIEWQIAHDLNDPTLFGALVEWRKEVEMKREEKGQAKLPVKYHSALSGTYTVSNGCARHNIKVIDNNGELCMRNPWEIALESNLPADFTRAKQLQPNPPKTILLSIINHQIVRAMQWTFNDHAKLSVETRNFGVLHCLVERAAPTAFTDSGPNNINALVLKNFGKNAAVTFEEDPELPTATSDQIARTNQQIIEIMHLTPEADIPNALETANFGVAKSLITAASKETLSGEYGSLALRLAEEAEEQELVEALRRNL